ncbi:MAG: phosphoribosyltransferase family protein [Patescibacteria group bacterium]
MDQLFVVSDFKNRDVESLIKLFKYRFLIDLAEPLGLLASKYINHLAKRDHFSIVEGNPLLVPVPLHRTREYWRGFNQSQLISGLIAKRYQLDTNENLICVAQGIHQAELEDKEERLSNVDGLYSVISPEVFTGRNIILIDDVCTTGATLNECAKVLKSAGAKSVTALAIARG